MQTSRLLARAAAAGAARWRGATHDSLTSPMRHLAHAAAAGVLGTPRARWHADTPTRPSDADAAAAAAAADEAASDAATQAEAAAEGALAADLQAAVSANADLRDRLARSLADMENLRDRTTRQVESAKAFAVSGLVKNLFDVADNLERARATATPEGDGAADDDTAPARLAALVEGVELTERGLHSALRAAGVERIDTEEGAAFDPHEMDAAFSVPPSPAGPPSGTVAAVTKAGYRLNGRVVRAAVVGVVRDD